MKQHLQPQHFPSHSYKCNNFNHFPVPTRVTRFYCENWRKYERRGMVYMLWKFLLLICHSLFSCVILKSKILEDKKGVKRNVEVLFPRLIIYTKSFFSIFIRKERKMRENLKWNLYKVARNSYVCLRCLSHSSTGNFHFYVALPCCKRMMSGQNLNSGKFGASTLNFISLWCYVVWSST